jgi:AcrR family transcriptional regulator
MKPDVTSVVEDPDLVEKRRSQIVSAATELFAEQGFHRTTIKDIAKRAGFSPGLVYLYVREKEDVLLLVLLRVLEEHRAELPGAVEGVTDPLERLVRLIDAFTRIVDRHRAATVIAYRSAHLLTPDRRLLVEDREREVDDIVVETLVACMKAGLVRKLDVDVVTHQIVMIAHGWALKSWYFKGRTDLEAYVAANLDVVMVGLTTPAGAERWHEIEAARRTGATP